MYTLIQFAVYVKFSVTVAGFIVTVVCGVSPFEPVQPLNSYPSFVGAFNVISSSSTVYTPGFSVEFVPSSKLYVIVYSVASQFAVYILSSTEPLFIVITLGNSPFSPISIPVPVHPLNVYPFFVGSFSIVTSFFTVYVVGFPSTSIGFPSDIYFIVYSNICQCAVYSLGPVEPVDIVTSVGNTPLSSITISVPVHPKNLYPFLIG